MAGRKGVDKTRYGIHEWYGLDIRNISADLRKEFVEHGMKKPVRPCPFLQKQFPGHLCKKKGGVCSMRPYTDDGEGIVSKGVPVTICPERFWQDSEIFHDIGRIVLGAEEVRVIREVPFLRNVVLNDPSLAEDDEEDGASSSVDGDSEDQGREASGRSVGRIDLVLQSVADQDKVCLVEIQSVYFSGEKMIDHIRQFLEEGQSLPWPDRIRRPDFRSSGPKRLMPQLQIKVPSVSRWGFKLVVVIDRRFFANMAPMEREEFLSNSEVIWYVVDYDLASGRLVHRETVMTTLESSVKGLTAGKPTSREDFLASVNKAGAKGRRDAAAGREGLRPKTFLVR